MTLPATTMKLLADHSCSVQAAKGQAVITTDEGIRVCSRVLDGTYPDVAKLIPADFEHRMTLNRHRLTRALERVALVAEATNGVVKIAAASSKLTISAEADASNGREVVAYDGTGKGQWAFNVAYLLDGLKAFRGHESIELSCNAATTPVVLRPAGSEDQTYLVMPVQVRA
jgi:DNA polymerase-3 subunit beta